jgi:hypothetical protein
MAPGLSLTNEDELKKLEQEIKVFNISNIKVIPF